MLVVNLYPFESIVTFDKFLLILQGMKRTNPTDRDIERMHFGGILKFSSKIHYGKSILYEHVLCYVERE